MNVLLENYKPLKISIAMNNYIIKKQYYCVIRSVILLIICVHLSHIENIAQELHTIEGAGGFGSSTGITLIHDATYSLFNQAFNDNAKGRIWNTGKAINIGYGTGPYGGRLGFGDTYMLGYTNSLTFRKVSGNTLDVAFDWGVKFSHVSNAWGANNSRPWLRQGWRGDGTIDANGADGDYLYIGSTGNRDNINQFAMMISAGGIAIGRGDNSGEKLSDVLIKFKNISGKGRVVTDELEIRGGADLAENFDIIKADELEIEPGNIVSISEEIDGKLELCNRPFDKRIVGVVSGANGVSTGMYMGQDGTLAYGDYPIALTGRVYVKTNKENGAIKLGDFLTSSSRAGEAMKVNDISKAQGAIIGKAMTTVDELGFVLVLVNLQ